MRRCPIGWRPRGNSLPTSTPTIAGHRPSHVHARRSVELPVWRGELRSSARAHLLPNVYSARVRQKRERGRVEALIERYAEPLATQVPAFGWPPAGAPTAPGCSCCGTEPTTPRAAAPTTRWPAMSTPASRRHATIGEDIVVGALTSFGSRVPPTGGMIRFNPSPFEREGVPGNGWARRSPRGTTPSRCPSPIEILPDGAGVAGRGHGAEVLRRGRRGGPVQLLLRARRTRSPKRPHRVEVHGHEVEVTWEAPPRPDADRSARGRAVPPDRRRAPQRTHRSPDPFARGAGRRCVTARWRARRSNSSSGPSWARGARSEAGSAYLARARGRDGGRHGRPARRCLRVRDPTQAPAIAVTLLRCVGRISAEPLATRPFEAGPANADPEAQMPGETVFSLGIWPARSQGPPR